MKKRGQVTLFVIVGIVLLIVVLLLLYLNTKKTDNQPNLVDKYSETISNDMVPLKNNVEFCLAKTAKEGFKELGLHGGFINPPPFIQYDVVPGYKNTGLEEFKGSGIIMPFWSYIDSPPDCRTCKFKDNSPPLEGTSTYSVQTQIQSYINENLLSCLNDFSDYKQKYNISYDSPKSVVQFDDNDVFVGLDWNITASIGTTTTSASKFNTIIDLQFKRLYAYARSLLFQSEQLPNKRISEDLMQTIINTLSTGAQNAVIPPADGPMIEGFDSIKTWNLQDVRKIFKEYLSQNINYLQVEGTKDSYRSFSNNPYDQTLYSRFQMPFVSDDTYYQQVKTRFNFFPDWPIYVKTNPGYGDFVMPETLYKNIIFFTFSFANYKFSYDVTYPVMVTLEDSQAFNNEGYLFQYAYESNIRNNAPYTNGTIFVNSSLYDDNSTSEYTANDQRTVPVTISTINGYNKVPLEGVQLAYQCVDSSVIVGITQISNGRAGVDTKLPPCIGGYFYVLNRNITANKFKADIYDGVGPMTYEVYPEQNFTLKIRKRMYSPIVAMSDLNADNSDRNWLINPSVNAYEYPNANDSIIIVFARMDGDTETGYMKVAKINGTKEPSIMIAPGTYRVFISDMMALNETNNITIPNVTLSSGSIFTSDVDVPGQVFNESIMIGMAAYDNTTRYLELNPKEMKNKNSMTIYVPAIDPTLLKTGIITDLKVYEKFLNVTLTKKELFQPKFS